MKIAFDATNYAFNCINQQAALHKIGILCPPIAQIINNTYQSPVRVIMPGSGEILSTEGTTQGDPLAMAMYAIAVTPNNPSLTILQTNSSTGLVCRR